LVALFVLVPLVARAQGKAPVEAAPSLERLTFDEAVQRALERNPTARQAATEIRRFRALVEQTRAASLPTLDAAGVYTGLDGERIANGALLLPASAINLSATLTVPLVNARGWAQWAQALDQVDVARMSAEDVQRTLAIATGRGYLAVIRAKRLVETAKIAVENAAAHYEFTRAQTAGGIGNKLDEARAAQELTADRAFLQEQEAALYHAREALGVFVAGELPVDVSEWSFGPMPDLGEGLAEARALRSDVRLRDRAADAADRVLRQSYTDYLPSLKLFASPFYQNPALPTVPETGWQVQLAAAVPIYDGGLRGGLEHERRARASEAHLQTEATVRQARSEVRDAVEEVRRADLALVQARQSTQFAHQALQLAELAYRNGLTTNLDVIDAERKARDADTEVAIAEDGTRQGRLDLLAASGRFPTPR
jgi:outer membrane protein TolC